MPRKTPAAKAARDARARPSMRPRPDAAENAPRRGHSRTEAGPSMRPRPDAAENARRPDRDPAGQQPSMRPRPDAAENMDGKAPSASRYRAFNEAAARCRGKRRRRVRPVHRHAVAFNEAAARCRGKPSAGYPVILHGTAFNEAAARCRGKLWLPFSGAGDLLLPSMRPRPDAAETASGTGSSPTESCLQ